MASLSEHAEVIKAAIQAAVDDGFKVDADVTVVYREGLVEPVEVGVWDGLYYINVFTEDRS